MFLYTKVKGYFCSLLVSNIFCLPLFLLYRPTFFLRFYNPFFHTLISVLLSCKQDTLYAVSDYFVFL